MLVLSRERDEEIVIGDEVIVIMVVDIRGDKVRLGVKAPSHVKVHRREVYDEIKRKKTLIERQKHSNHGSGPGPDTGA